MSYLDWKVGDKVVCVDAQNIPFPAGSKNLVEGDVYVIRSIHICPLTEDVGLRLESIRNCINPFTGNEYAYRISRFRPLQTRKTDISCFTAMLTPKKQRVRA